MVPVSTAEKNFVEKTFFVSTFLDKYIDRIIISPTFGLNPCQTSDWILANIRISLDFSLCFD